MPVASREVFHYRESKLRLAAGCVAAIAIPFSWIAFLQKTPPLLTASVLVITSSIELMLLWSIFHACNGEIAIEGDELVQYDYLGRECVRTPLSEIYVVAGQRSWCPPGSMYVLDTKGGRIYFTPRISRRDQLLDRLKGIVAERSVSSSS